MSRFLVLAIYVHSIPTALALFIPRKPTSSCTDVSTQGTGWLVTNFEYSDTLTGGSEPSLADIISISCNLAITATGQSTTCLTTVSLDQGVKWDPNNQYDCQLQPQVSTQFSFNNVNNSLSIYQTWACPEANLPPFRLAGSGGVPLACKTHDGSRENDCDTASTTVAGLPVH